ncbi:hypothetical protein ACHAWF_002797 [Thalassiosira exigua]
MQKLNCAQMNYTVQEKEFLSVVMTLKEFRTMLVGAELHVSTDHANNRFEILRSQGVLRWRSFLEEYSPTLHYVKGDDNVVADMFSRQGIADTLSGKTGIPRAKGYPLEGKNDAPNTAQGSLSPATMLEAYVTLCSECTSSIEDDLELSECLLNLTDKESFLNLPLEKVEENLLNIEMIHHKQYEDDVIKRWLRKFLGQFRTIKSGNANDLIIYVKKGDNPARQWQIALPHCMIDERIKWYHIVTGHPGAKRLHSTLSSKYYNPNLRGKVDKYHYAD